jgi:integrase
MIALRRSPSNSVNTLGVSQKRRRTTFVPQCRGPTSASARARPKGARRGACRCGGMGALSRTWRRGGPHDWPRAPRAGDQPFVASLLAGREMIVFSRHTLRKRFRTACRVLGAERLRSLTIHHGRHTFISHALAGGRTLAEVRDAAGHSNVSITSGYLHVSVEDQTVGALFG